jgi:hypothetical protein
MIINNYTKIEEIVTNEMILNSLLKEGKYKIIKALMTWMPCDTTSAFKLPEDFCTNGKKYMEIIQKSVAEAVETYSTFSKSHQNDFNTQLLKLSKTAQIIASDFYTQTTEKKLLRKWFADCNKIVQATAKSDTSSVRSLDTDTASIATIREESTQIYFDVLEYSNLLGGSAISAD